MEEITDKAALKALFKLNQRLEIGVNEKQGVVSDYKSRIEEVKDDRLVIAMPMAKGAAVSAREGDYIQVKLLLGQLSYLFTSRFISRQLSPLPVWSTPRSSRLAPLLVMAINSGFSGKARSTQIWVPIPLCSKMMGVVTGNLPISGSSAGCT